MLGLANVMLVAIMAIAVAPAAANPLPDPTRPANAAVSRSSAPAGPARPVLQSTIVSPGRKAAVISGTRVRIGDTFQGAVVTDIAPYEVRMNRGGREVVLRLAPKLATDKGTVE